MKNYSRKRILGLTSLVVVSFAVGGIFASVLFSNMINTNTTVITESDSLSLSIISDFEGIMYLGQENTILLNVTRLNGLTIDEFYICIEISCSSGFTALGEIQYSISAKNALSVEYDSLGLGNNFLLDTGVLKGGELSDTIFSDGYAYDWVTYEITLKPILGLFTPTGEELSITIYAQDVDIYS